MSKRSPVAKKTIALAAPTTNPTVVDCSGLVKGPITRIAAMTLLMS